MHPIVLFPLVLTVAFVFTLIVKKTKKHPRRNVSGKDDGPTPCNETIAHVHRCEVLPDVPLSQEITKTPMLGTKDVDATEKEILATRNAELETENARLKVENLKLKTRSQKKAENLAGYHEGNKKVRMATRKRRQSKLAASKTTNETGTDGAPPRNKRTGKPKGGRGGGFKAPSNIDREVEWALTHCPRCKRSLESSRPVGKWYHVIMDVVELKRGMQMEYVRHVIYRYRCPGCHQLVAKDFGFLARMHYGIGLISFVMEERLDRRGTWEGIRGTMFRIFVGRDDEEIIPTIVTFIDWMVRWEPQVRQLFEAFRAAVKDTSFAHVDESGVPMDGKNHWLWVVVTSHVILYLASESRGHETIKDLFDGYKG
nr:transposase [Candidatus Sigynarchaeota archaeon]